MCIKQFPQVYRRALNSQTCMDFASFMDVHYQLVAFIMGLHLLWDCIYYMGLLHLLYGTAAFIIRGCCIYYMRLLHILYGTAAFIICDCYIYYMGLLHLLYATATYNYILYGTAAFIIWDCCAFII